MAGMKQGWPKSKLAQAGIAFLMAAITTVFVFSWVETSRFKLYARLYPHDGLDGLGALMDALQAGFWTLLGVFTLVFIVQRLLTRA